MSMHINALVTRKGDVAALETHNMWHSALGVRWKSGMGILHRTTLFFCTGSDMFECVMMI